MTRAQNLISKTLLKAFVKRLFGKEILSLFPFVNDGHQTDLRGENHGHEAAVTLSQHQKLLDNYKNSL